MGKTVIGEELFPEIIDRYNTEGRRAAYGLIRNKYGVKQPYAVMTRIKASGRYCYDVETDQFTCTQKDSIGNVFMELDELCQSTGCKPKEWGQNIVNGHPAELE